MRWSSVPVVTFRSGDGVQPGRIYWAGECAIREEFRYISLDEHPDRYSDHLRLAPLSEVLILDHLFRGPAADPEDT